MGKILFVITAEIYVRNYLRTGVLDALSSQHDVFLISPKGLSLSEEIQSNPNFLEFFAVDDRQASRHRLLFDLTAWRYRNKSRTFAYRWMKNSGYAEVASQTKKSLWLGAFVKWCLVSLLSPKWILIPLLASAPLFIIASRVLRVGLKPGIDLHRIVTENQWDLIVFPSAFFDSVSVDLSLLGKSKTIPTLCLVDNWDNLTSKTVFWAKPSAIGVWGQQSKLHAVGIHGFPSDNVHIVGSPRFEGYLDLRHGRPPAPYKFPYFLFVGAAMPFDEIAALKRLEHFLISAGEPFAEYQIVYRPHPWQQKRKTPANFTAQDFSRTFLDRQIEIEYQKSVPSQPDNAFQPALEYYPGLLSQARLVTGPLTTMLLEASLCATPVLALAYHDGHHFNPANGYFTHFDGIEAIPGFHICRQVANLEIDLEKVLSLDRPDFDTLREQTDFYLHQNPRGYHDGLINVVDALLAKGGETDTRTPRVGCEGRSTVLD